MNFRHLKAAALICFLGVTGCQHVENSEIVARFKAAGGGNPDRAEASQISAWFSKHADIRKELTPLCKQRQKQAEASWANSDEGKVCTGLTQANFFAKPNITSDHVAF